MHFYPLQKRGSCGSSSSLSSVLPPYTRGSSPFWAGRHTGTTPRPKGANERRLKRRRQRDHRRSGRKRDPKKSPNRRRRRRRSPSITSLKRSASNRNQNTPSPNASTSRHRDDFRAAGSTRGRGPVFFGLFAPVGGIVVQKLPFRPLGKRLRLLIARAHRAARYSPPTGRSHKSSPRRSCTRDRGADRWR